MPFKEHAFCFVTHFNCFCGATYQIPAPIAPSKFFVLLALIRNDVSRQSSSNGLLNTVGSGDFAAKGRIESSTATKGRLPLH